MRDNKMKMILVGMITGLVNGLLGSGGGTIVVPAMERILKVEEHHAHATAIAVIFPLSLISATVYIIKQPMKLSYIGLIMIGGVVGGFVGAKLLNKISGKYLHKLFGLFMIVAAVRMIFA